MKALILAAGLGKRLGLKDLPKPMYEINGKPILEHNILLLKKHNIEDIFINLHYMPDVIKNYFGDGKKWGVNIQYSYEKELQGTSGALKKIEDFFTRESFFVIYGDNYTEIDLTDMMGFHKINNAIATVGVFDPEKSLNSRIAGGIVTIDQNNNLNSFIEGSRTKIKGYVNAGVYVLEHGILDFIPTERPSDFGNDIFPQLLIKGFPVKAYLTKSFVIAIDTQDALDVASRVVEEGGI
jgi:NDP-sugar pyrophosphorylase family protein